MLLADNKVQVRNIVIGDKGIHTVGFVNIMPLFELKNKEDSSVIMDMEGYIEFKNVNGIDLPIIEEDIDDDIKEFLNTQLTNEFNMLSKYLGAKIASDGTMDYIFTTDYSEDINDIYDLLKQEEDLGFSSDEVTRLTRALKHWNLKDRFKLFKELEGEINESLGIMGFESIGYPYMLSVGYLNSRKIEDTNIDTVPRKLRGVLEEEFKFSTPFCVCYTDNDDWVLVSKTIFDYKTICTFDTDQLFYINKKVT